MRRATWRPIPELGAPVLISSAMKAYSSIQEGLVLPVNPPSIPGLGVTAGFQMWVQQKGSGTYAQLVDVARQIVQKARTRPQLARVSTTISATSPVATRPLTGRA